MREAVFGAGEPNETTLDEAGDSGDVFVARYAQDGEILWARRAGGTEFGDEGRAVTILSDGTIVVTGSFRYIATYGEDTPNETTFTSAGEHDIFIARYAPDGTFIGAHHSGGTGWDTSHGLTPLQNDAVLMTGRFAETCTFAADTPSATDLTSTDNNDVFLMRYSP